MPDPIGEDAWLAWVDEASRTAGDLEQRVGVVELYKKSLLAEPYSNKLWPAYCEWFWSLHTDCQNGDAGWPEQEQLLGQEVFSAKTALDVWQQGALATQYRLNDSHELWNRWISIELELLSTAPTKENIERIRELFMTRLQIPHATWDSTSAIFSSFINKYDEPSYEATMVKMTKLAKDAKGLYEKREVSESQLKRAIESGDIETAKSVMKSYLDWESEQAVKKSKKNIPLAPTILSVALYERAVTSTYLGEDATVWEDYIVFLSSDKIERSHPLPDILSVIQRATTHCPWSGALWARYILHAESANLPFETMERIKHAATDNRLLDRDGMGSVVELYVAWVGFLKRRTMVPGANGDDIDIAEMGLPTALESVHEWGQKRHGRDWKGDPLFRIERIFIQYLTQRRSFEEARGYWLRLVNTHGDSYEFWQQYYLWEMTVREPSLPPTAATSVLNQAIRRPKLDWPEKMMEIYVRHCNNYEGVGELLDSMATVHRLAKKVAQRRQKEQEDAAALYAQQQPQEAIEEISAENELPSGASKRKWESFSEGADGGAKKKVKRETDPAALQEQHLKRDRENTTVIVSNISPESTQTRVRQYFKEYGHINTISLQTESDKSSSIAFIEFREPFEAQSALLRDGKYFEGWQIRVKPGAGLTLFVTNFPPTADDNYLKNLFKDCGEIFNIRWPSLKKDAHRRFCYITFKTIEGAAAATQLDGKSLGGVYKLTAKHSNPGNRKQREGAIAEGRELHITGVVSSLVDDDLRQIFGKYGKIENVRMLTTLTGMNKGAAFIVFEQKEDAKAALELDKTKVKSSIITVEFSTEKRVKRNATIIGKASSASPAPDADVDSAMSPSPAPDHGTSREEISKRTITLNNIPDTINDARIRTLVEPYGSIVKLVLRHDHQGAIIEYAEASSAGRAALGLDNYEIVPGRRIRTGGMKELFAQKEEFKTDKLPPSQSKKGPAAYLAPNAPVRRPVGPGGRGGLGMKRGLGFSAANGGPSSSATNGEANENKKSRSNADFKAMFVKGEPDVKEEAN